ncbi:MAG: hypothetical protein JWQ40_6, partial [Segetibacter sp.]|nr:hypothetical protein [Segetibacter sp.]
MTIQRMSLTACCLLVFFSIIIGCQKEDETQTLQNTITITAKEAFDVSASATSVEAEIAVQGSISIAEKGVCWNTQSSPTINNNVTKEGTGSSSIKGSITGLQPATTYYVRAYCTDDKGQTTYSNEINFTTLTNVPALAITTGSATSVTATTASVTGSLSGTGTVTARGVCWSTSQNPTTNNSKTNNGTGTGNFTAALTGLTSGTTYYVRAYATTSTGTTYGNEVSFIAQTTNAPALTITTGSAASVTATTASVSGSIGGTGTVTTRGICWSTSQNPTTNNSKTNDGAGTGNFTAALTGLTAGTAYYVRAYATTSSGTTYGNEVSFTTLTTSAPTLTITTGSAASITATTASVTGSIGGTGTVTARGICWSTSQNPTTNNSKTNNGTGTGNFTAALTSLTAGTTYYVRAYATTSTGTTYG